MIELGARLRGLCGLTILATVLALALSWPAAAAHAAEMWRDYTSKEGRFSVLFPGEPQIKVEAGGGAVVGSHEFLVQLGAIVFDVSYDDYVPGTLAVQSKTYILEIARDRLIKGQPVRLLADKIVQTGSNVGREVVFQDGDGYTQIFRLYVAGDRVYQTIAGGPAGTEHDPDVLRFQNSFQMSAPAPTPLILSAPIPNGPAPKPPAK
jgi:hypothetical protein